MKKIARSGFLRVCFTSASVLLLAAMTQPALATDEKSGAGQVLDEIRKGLSGISKYFWTPGEQTPAPAAPSAAQGAQPDARPSQAATGTPAAPDAPAADPDKGLPAAQSAGSEPKADAAASAGIKVETPAPAASAETKVEPQAPATSAGIKVETPAPAASAETKVEPQAPAASAGIKVETPAPAASAETKVEPQAPATSAGIKVETPAPAASAEIKVEPQAPAASAGIKVETPSASAGAGITVETPAETAGESKNSAAKETGSYVFVPERGSDLERNFGSTGIPASVMQANGEIGRTDGRWVYFPPLPGLVPSVDGLMDKVLDASDKGDWVGEGERWVYVFGKGQSYAALIGEAAREKAVATVPAGEAAAAAQQQQEEAASPAAAGDENLPATAQNETRAEQAQQAPSAPQEPGKRAGAETMGGMNSPADPSGPGRWTSVNGRWLYLPNDQPDMMGMGGMAALVDEAPAQGGWLQRGGRWAYVAPLPAPTRPAAAKSRDDAVPAPVAEASAPEATAPEAVQSAATAAAPQTGAADVSPADTSPADVSPLANVDGRDVNEPGQETVAPAQSAGSEPAGQQMAAAGTSTAGRWANVDGHWVYVAGEQQAAGQLAEQAVTPKARVGSAVDVRRSASLSSRWVQREGIWLRTDANPVEKPAESPVSGASAGTAAPLDAASPQPQAAAPDAAPRTPPTQSTLPGIAVIGTQAAQPLAETPSAEQPRLDTGRNGLAESQQQETIVTQPRPSRVNRDYSLQYERPLAAERPVGERALGGHVRRSARLGSEDRSDAVREAAPAGNDILFFVPGQVPGTGMWYSAPANILSSARPVVNPAFAGGR